jgi:electron transfer flavoprotein beta subunit
MGADDAVLVEGNDLSGPAPQETAYILAKAIEKIGGYDLILCGRQAADWDQGQVGCGIAEHLDLPYVSIVSKIEAIEKALRIQCLTEDGYEVMEVPLPAVLTLTNEINQPRLTTVAGILKTTMLKIPVWSLQDIGVDPVVAAESGRLTELKNLCIPEVKVECQIVGGETPEEAALSLVNVLRSDKVI